MKYAFKHITLHAESLYALINDWVEMQLLVEEEKAYLFGYGYAYEIAEAFTTLVLDWEARIYMPTPTLPPGQYDLVMLEEGLYACQKQQKWLLEDREVRVEVKAA